MTSPRVATAKTFMEHFSKCDKAALLSMITPDFKYTFAPSTVPFPPKNGDEWSEHLDMFVPMLESYPLDYKLVIDCGAEENKVVLMVEGEPQFKAAAKDDELPADGWKWKGDFLLIFTLVGEGKVQAITEFVDTKGMDSLIVLMQRAGGNLQKAMAKES